MATIGLLNLVGAPRALALLAGVAGVAALGFVGLRRSQAPRFTAPIAGVVAIVCACLGLFGARALSIHVAKGISLDQSPPEFTQWNAFCLSFSRVEGRHWRAGRRPASLASPER